MIGYQVDRERIVGHKKVDLYFQERRFGSMRRVAVECKAYSLPLDANSVSLVYANYLPLLQANLIDEILLVTEGELTPAAATLVVETREMSHVTFTDLELNLMDFTRYTTELVDQYSADGLASYYIRPELADSRDLETVVIGEIDAKASKPIAILGGYGLGKTTFARRLSFVLATRRIADPAQRAPVLLRLGEISSEQTLEGLLGKALTATSIVRNYSFDLFMRLNRLGRFVLILDGFDEMKHSLTPEEFRYNFRQVNRLISGESRVVLLGRPTAFLNDEEQYSVLHGIRRVGELVYRDVDWPDYQEMYLAGFTRPQVFSFLNGYLEYRAATAKTVEEVAAINQVRTEKLGKLSGKRFADIARRPVQLKMLAEILPNWRGDINTLTTAELYSVFIDLVIDRELEKESRLRFGVSQRREFARHLAWWLWVERREANVSAADIPDSIISNFCSDGDEIAIVRRDLVSACFLEKKLGESLYFPHRSFQEFLVAEELVERLRQGTISLADADPLINDEIAEFLSELVSVTTLRSWESILEEHQGTLSWRVVKVWTSQDCEAYFRQRVDSTYSPWYPLLLTVGLYTGRFGTAASHDIVKQFLDRLSRISALLRDKELDDASRLQELRYALTIYVCTTILGSICEEPDYIVSALANILYLSGYTRVENKTALNKRDLLINIRRGKDKRFKKQYNVDPLVLEFRTKILVNPKKHSLELGATYPWLAMNLRTYAFVSEWLAGATIKLLDFQLPTLIVAKPSKEFDAVVAAISPVESHIAGEEHR